MTTISKSGTNEFHGGLFWYHQNAALNATAFGQQTKPSLIDNDFGVTAGGPVFIPHLYNGKNKTFFFGTYEGLRLPRSETIQNQVPTAAMRTGDFSASGITVTDPTTGAPFPNDIIPSGRISSVATGFLSLYPTPNAGSTNSPHAANYVVNRDESVNSDQFDARIDHYLTSKYVGLRTFHMEKYRASLAPEPAGALREYLDQLQAAGGIVELEPAAEPDQRIPVRLHFESDHAGPAVRRR